MAEKHFYRFPTVDFFGKSMPGVLFTLFSLSLFPAQLITKNEFITSMTLATVVTAIFVVIVVGFTVGQGLNTLTIVIQKSFYWLGLKIHGFLHFVGFPDYRFWTELIMDGWTAGRDSNDGGTERVETNEKSKGSERETNGEDFEDRRERTSNGERTGSNDAVATEDGRSIAYTLYLRMKFWIWMRYLNFKTIFIPHRTAFENRLQRHMAEEKPEEYPNVELFKERYEAMVAELNGPAPPFPTTGETVYDVEVSEDLYPLISSYLTKQGITRSQRHKALYVFCRNTTNVLFLFAVAYAVMAVIPAFFNVNHLLSPGPDTYIATLLNGAIKDMLYIEMYHLSALLFAASLNFLYSTGEYKRYYIEYMIADFNHVAPKETGDGGPDRSD